MWDGCCGGGMLRVCTQEPSLCPGCDTSSFPGQSDAAPPRESSQVPNKHLKGWSQLWGRIQITLR